MVILNMKDKLRKLGKNLEHFTYDLNTKGTEKSVQSIVKPVFKPNTEDETVLTEEYDNSIDLKTEDVISLKDTQVHDVKHISENNLQIRNIQEKYTSKIKEKNKTSSDINSDITEKNVDLIATNDIKSKISDEREIVCGNRDNPMDKTDNITYFVNQIDDALKGSQVFYDKSISENSSKKFHMRMVKKKKRSKGTEININVSASYSDNSENVVLLNAGDKIDVDRETARVHRYENKLETCEATSDSIVKKKKKNKQKKKDRKSPIRETRQFTGVESVTGNSNKMLDIPELQTLIEKDKKSEINEEIVSAERIECDEDSPADKQIKVTYKDEDYATAHHENVCIEERNPSLKQDKIRKKRKKKKHDQEATVTSPDYADLKLQEDKFHSNMKEKLTNCKEGRLTEEAEIVKAEYPEDKPFRENDETFTNFHHTQKKAKKKKKQSNLKLEEQGMNGYNREPINKKKDSLHTTKSTDTTAEDNDKKAFPNKTLEQNLKPLTKEKTRQNLTEKYNVQSLLESESETIDQYDGRQDIFHKCSSEEENKGTHSKTEETAFVKMKRIEKNLDDCIKERSEPKRKKRNRKEPLVQKDGPLSEGEPFVRDANETLNMNVEDLLNSESNKKGSNDEIDDTRKQSKKKRKNQKKNTDQSSGTPSKRSKTSPVSDEQFALYEQIPCPEEDADCMSFSFIVPQSVWVTIAPIMTEYSNKRHVRRLKGNWTDVFSQNTNEIHKGCVLSFKKHHVKAPNSRKISGTFVHAIAYCKGAQCSAKFVFSIECEPSFEDNVPVNCTVTGCIAHLATEVNRRNLTGINRQSTAAEILKASSVKTYYDNVLKGNIDQMKAGNYTTVPNPDVLRKVVSEIVQKENLHSNIMAEIQVLKESYEKMNDPYIREIGLDPFCVIMYSDFQLQLLKDLSNERKLHLYIDATGSVISSIPEQKRPYLYSMVVKPKHDVPSVSIADMLSTQHTIPRIELFLATVKRSLSLKGKIMQVQKVETDFSFAIIQACLHAFNNCNLKSYLFKCYRTLAHKSNTETFTIHHLCSSHIIKDLSRQLKKYKPSLKSMVRKNIFRSFALLQNSTTLSEAQSVYRDMCVLCLSRFKSTDTDACMKRLKRRLTEIEDFNDNVNDEDEDLLTVNDLDEQTVDEHKTIKESSPFTKIFNVITNEVKAEIDVEPSADKGNNIFYCPEVIDCLTDKFMPILPMWTGCMLAKLNSDEEIMTRDSNNPVENWFKVVKHDIGLKKRVRPYKLIVALKQHIYAKLIEFQFPACRKKKTKKRQNKTDIELNLSEEVWKKHSKKKTTYQTTPRVKKVEEGSTTVSKYPNVMRWGGKYQSMHLANTCTIDNALTILHLKYCENTAFASKIEGYTEHIFTTLLSVFRLMSEGEFTKAKFIWISHMKVSVQSSTNLFGDEVDYFVKFFDNEWRSYSSNTCSSSICPTPFKETKDTSGINVSTSEQFDSVQELIDLWFKRATPCASSNIDCENETEESDELQCDGIRTEIRHIMKSSPILVLRLYEHCLYGRTTLKNILFSETVRMDDTDFILAGVTIYSEGHYTAIIVSSLHGNLWYDGLAGKLEQIPNDTDSWFPSHAIYCQVWM